MSSRGRMVGNPEVINHFSQKLKLCNPEFWGLNPNVISNADARVGALLLCVGRNEQEEPGGLERAINAGAPKDNDATHNGRDTGAASSKNCRSAGPSVELKEAEATLKKLSDLDPSNKFLENLRRGVSDRQPRSRYR